MVTGYRASNCEECYTNIYTPAGPLALLYLFYLYLPLMSSASFAIRRREAPLANHRRAGYPGFAAHPHLITANLRLNIAALPGLLHKGHALLAVPLPEEVRGLHTGGTGGRVFVGSILGRKIAQMGSVGGGPERAIEQNQSPAAGVAQARQVRLHLLQGPGQE